MVALNRVIGVLFRRVAIVATLALASALAAFAQGDLTMLDESVEAPYALGGTLHVSDPATLKAEIVLDYTDPGNGYVLRISPGAVTVERVKNGAAERIGISHPYGRFTPDSDLELTVRRDTWRIELILDRQVLARAYDSTFHGGNVGYAVTGGDVPDAMLQPLGGVFMEDDFMRTEDAQSAWQAVRGVWRTQSLRTDSQSDRMNAEHSANAFSYQGKAGSVPAISCAGYWFWSDYSLKTAVRCSDGAPLGVVAYFQDDRNYLLARWTSAASSPDDANRLELVGVVNGEREVLAEASGGYLPDQWYEIELRVCDGIVQVLVDDEPRLAANADLFGQGQPGLYCEGTALFDSVVVEPWEVLSDRFQAVSPGRWVPMTGSWHTDAGHMRGGGADALVLTGRPEWERYSVATDVYADGHAAVGIVACAGGGRYFALRIGAAGSGVGYDGQAQLVRVEGGEATELATAPAVLPAGTWHQARLVVDDGLLIAYLDGKRILDAFDVEATSGRIGLYADGSGAGLYDNVYVSMLPPPRIARVTKEFTLTEDHAEMAEWASTRAPWVKPEDPNGTWWTKGDYFGDKIVAFDLPAVGAKTGELRLRLDAAPDEPDSGLTLVIAATQGSRTLALSLLSSEQTLGGATVAVASDPCPLRIERRGAFVVVVVDGSVVLNVNVTQ